MGVDPDVSSSQITLYSFHGALIVRFDRKARRVRVTLHRYEGAGVSRNGEAADPCSTCAYEPVITSRGERSWRRLNFEHGEQGMALVIVYHLLKYRLTAEK